MKAETEAAEATVDSPDVRTANAPVPSDVGAALLDTLSNLPDGILLVDRDWRIIYANEQGRRIGRIRPQDLNGPSLWELYTATAGTDLERRYRRVMQERVPDQFEFSTRRLNSGSSCASFPLARASRWFMRM